jgi:iron(III) transport system permease protein
MLETRKAGSAEDPLRPLAITGNNSASDGVPPARHRFPPFLPLLLVLVVSILILYPLFEVLRQPLGRMPELSREAADVPRLGQILFRTVMLALGSMVLATLIAMVLAWCRANLAGRLGALAQIVAMVPLVIPPLAGVTGWTFLLSPRVGYLNQMLRSLPFLDHLDQGPFDIYTLPWIVIVTGIYLIPYAFIFIQAGLANIDPRLEDAARNAGSNWWGVQRRIVLPLLRPSLVYGGGVVALLALGQFTAALLLGRTKGIDVITTLLYRLTGSPPPNYPLATFIALPLLLLALAGIWAQRYALRGGTRFIMVGKGVGRGRSHNSLLLIPVFLYSFFLVIPPLIGLTIVALSPYWGGSLSPDDLTLMAFAEVFENPNSSQAIYNSLKLSIIATAGSLVLSLCAALVVLRTNGFAQRAIDYMINVPLAVPAILFGMGIFLSFALGPATLLIRDWFGVALYGSNTVLVLAYVVLTLPHGTRLIMSGIAQINPQLEAAARVFGSTALGTVLRILVPLLRRNLVSAAMLMFILSSHEFAASALLVGPNTQVMSTVLYGQWDTGTYPTVAALALVMVAIATVGLAAIVMFDRSDVQKTRGRFATLFARRGTRERA